VVLVLQPVPVIRPWRKNLTGINRMIDAPSPSIVHLPDCGVRVPGASTQRALRLAVAKPRQPTDDVNANGRHKSMYHEQHSFTVLIREQHA
jgi:hypothetical protein